MIIVDTSVWIDYFNGTNTRETEILDALLGIEPLAIGDLILTEILQGFRKNRDFETAQSLLLSFTVFEMLGTDNAIRSASNYRRLRQLGLMVRKTADVIIASFCIAGNHTLLFSDKAFLPFVTNMGLQTLR